DLETLTVSAPGFAADQDTINDIETAIDAFKLEVEDDDGDGPNGGLVNAYDALVAFSELDLDALTGPGATASAEVRQLVSNGLIDELDTKLAAAGDELAEVNLGVIAEVNSESFTLDGDNVTTAIMGAGVVNPVTVPELSATGTWTFKDVDLTITEDVVFNDSGSLVLDGVNLTIDGDVDLSDVDLTLTNTPIEVPDGSSLTLTVEQVDALASDITGSGTVKVIGDATAADTADTVDDTHLKTVGIDLSEVITTSGVLNFVALGAMDDDDEAAGHEIIGSAMDDNITLSDNGDTVTGGPGDDTLIGGADDDTFIVDEGTDTIVGLTADEGTTQDDVLIVEAEAQAGGINTFIATDETVNNGTATLTAVAAGATTIDVSEAGGTNGFTLTAEANASTGINGNKTLIGSDNDDVINGGDRSQEDSGRADILTGNGGADLFEFNLSLDDTATLEVETTQQSVDREVITLETSAPANTIGTADDEIEVDYIIGGAAGTALVSL
ncbi:MAG: hypothetical protein LC687_07340, partial [Actinobacteria bacterium]|nr:hypothetical protein [Actinomycetota bacterium]